MSSDTITETESGATAAAAEDMELENPESGAAEAEAPNGDGTKREREEEAEEGGENGVAGGSKKQKKVETSVEEARLVKMEDDGGGEEGEGKEAAAAAAAAEKKGPVSVGPKTFQSAVELFDYFFNFLRFWAPNTDVNKYEYMTLLDLITKGHPDPEKKIGVGIDSFQVRYHPQYKSRCFFLIRTDKTEDDFSFRKCVDHILPLPENMKAKPEVNKAFGRGGPRRGGGDGGRGGGGGRGRSRGRGGHFRR